MVFNEHEKEEIRKGYRICFVICSARDVTLDNEQVGRTENNEQDIERTENNEHLFERTGKNKILAKRTENNEHHVDQT